MQLALMILCLLGTAVFLILGLKANKEDEQVQARINSLSQREAKKKTSRAKQLENSFSHRVIFPLAQLVFDNTQAIIPLSSKSWVKSKLIQAGYQKPHYQKTFLGIQLLCTVILFGLFFSLISLVGNFSGTIGLSVATAFGLAGYGLPMLWLTQQAQKRQEGIQKSLADFLDLLVICMEAGLGLDVAINKITSLKSVKTSTYLREELTRYTRDVGFGRSRKDALLDMAERTGVDDLNAIINAIIQSYEMGTSVAHTLRVQADSLRTKRLTKAEEKANKIPVKMVIPIYVFLFPAIFVCIFGPIGMVMIDALKGIFAGASLQG
ncbi:type II secretion system F family protein [Vampirovibrio chlorellavorus]|uniref:type II secretion system F family protein n=1 Tax=Vampirovibrio chlorellavorus TaxID=758823 RepID=UPI0026EBEA4E|nr:type II secretion system F family protein [Vampirovibrio chlorellavorus]